MQGWRDQKGRLSNENGRNLLKHMYPRLDCQTLVLNYVFRGILIFTSDVNFFLENEVFSIGLVRFFVYFTIFE